MPKVKFTTEEVLICPKCGEQVEECSKCYDELCIEIGCKFDGYCKNGEHFCLQCGGKNE